MLTKIIMRSLLSSVLFAVTACGPSLRSQMSLPHLMPSGAPEAQATSRQAYIFVDQFIDARPSPEIAMVEDRAVAADNPPADAVVAGIRRALEKDGFTLSDTAPVILSGEVRNWSAKVTPGFSSKSESSAQLFIEVLDPANRRVYSGVYEGFSSKGTPGLDESDVRDTLEVSMTEAIKQLLADRQLIGLLASY